jgi:hypothetical protein
MSSASVSSKSTDGPELELNAVHLAKDEWARFGWEDECADVAKVVADAVVADAVVADGVVANGEILGWFIADGVAANSEIL